MTTEIATVEGNEVKLMQNLFQRAADTIVDASRLREEVTKLKAEVEELRAQVNSLRDTNSFLDESLQHARHDRDEAQAKVRELSADMNNLRVENGEHAHTIDVQRDTINSLSGRLTETAKDRDDAITHSLLMEEKVKELQSTLDEVTKALGMSRLARVLGAQSRHEREESAEPADAVTQLTQFPVASNF